MNFKILIKLQFLLIILFFSCNNQKFKIDTSSINVELKTVRFENEIFGISPNLLPGKIDSFKTLYPIFFDVYSEGVLMIGSPNEPMFNSRLTEFTTDYTMATVYESVKKEYSDISPEIAEITEAFKRAKYFLPNKEIPDIYTCISGFNQSVFTSDDFVAIALDNYLGSNSEYYNRLGIENYKKLKMCREKIPQDVITAWLMSEYEYAPGEDNLASQMIYQGKLLYLTDALFPQLPDTIKFSYTPAQLSWASSFEDKVWNFFVENKMLFNTNKIEINKYIQDAPFTAAFMNNSAPRIGFLNCV